MRPGRDLGLLSRSAIRAIYIALPAALVASGGAQAQTSPADAPPAQLVLRFSDDRPQLVLIGTVLGKGKGLAFFIKDATGAIFLLKSGEEHAGWTLSEIKPSEVALQKDGETVRIRLQARPVDRASAKLSPQLPLAEGQRVPTAFKAPANLRPADHAPSHR